MNLPVEEKCKRPVNHTSPGLARPAVGALRICSKKSCVQIFTMIA